MYKISAEDRQWFECRLKDKPYLKATIITNGKI